MKSENRKGKKKTVTPYQVLQDPKVESLIRELKKYMEVEERRGRKDGALNIPRHDQKTVVEAELEIKALCENYGQQIVTILATLFAKIVAKLESKKRIKLLFDENPYKAVMELSKQRGDQLGIQIQALDNEKQGKIKLNNESITFYEKEYEKDLTERNKSEDKLKRRPRKRSLATNIIYYLSVVIIIFGDAFLIVNNLEKVAEMPFFFSCISALALGAGIAVSGHHLGSSVKGRHRTGIIGSLLGGLIILAFFFFLREESGGLGLMTLANLGLFVVFSVMAFFWEYDYPKLTKQYFGDEKSAKENAKKANKLKADNIKIEREFENEKMAVLKKHYDDLERKTQEYRTKVTEEVEALTVQKHEVEQYNISCLSQIRALYDEHVRKYRSLNQDERKDKGILLVEMWEESNYIEPLNLPSIDSISTKSLITPPLTDRTSMNGKSHPKTKNEL